MTDRVESMQILITELIDLRQQVKGLEQTLFSREMDIEARDCQLAALKAGQGEPVAKVKRLSFEHGCCIDTILPEGTALYTSAPSIPEGYALLQETLIDECRDDILNGRGALEAVLDNDQTNAVLAVFDEYFFTAAPKQGEKK